MITYRADRLEDMGSIAKDILHRSRGFKTFALKGEMGAGKTTLIKEFLRILGVDDPGSSPTFSLVNEYRTADGEPVYHFDFYRVEDESDIYDIGYEEYFFSDTLCFVEWPEKMGDLLPDDAVGIHFTVDGKSREIQLFLPN